LGQKHRVFQNGDDSLPRSLKQAPELVAFRAIARLLEQELAEGELAKMIGGNRRCVLARGLELAMPSVVDGSDYLPAHRRD
jgi:hypothetical protein